MAYTPPAGIPSLPPLRSGAPPNTIPVAPDFDAMRENLRGLLEAALVTAADLASALSTSTGLNQTQVDARVSTVGAGLFATPTQVNQQFAALVNAAPAALDTLGELATALQSDQTAVGTLTTGLAARAYRLTDAGVKTGNYTLAANEIVFVDATATALTMTIPTGTVDGTRFGVKKIDTGNNLVNVNVTGTDRFNKAGGSSTVSLRRPNQLMIFQYIAGRGVLLVQDSIDLTDLLTYLSQTYAPLSASGAAFEIGYSGEQVYDNYDLIPSGFPISNGNVIGSIAIFLDAPANGDQTWTFWTVHADGTSAQIGTVAVVSGTLGKVNATITSATGTVVQGDLIYVRLTAHAGSFLGVGPSAQIAYGSVPITIPAAPATPTGVTVTAHAGGGNDISWTTTTNALRYIVTKNGAAYGAAYAPGTSFYDASGTSSDTYRIQAAIPRSASAASSAVGVGGSNAFNYFSQSDGAPVGGTVLLGGSGSGQSVSVVSSEIVLTSGTAGGAATADKVGYKYPIDGVAHLLYDYVELVKFANSISIWQLYLAANDLGNTFTFTNGWQFEFTPSQGRIGYKASGYASGAFQTLAGYTNWGATGTGIGSSVPVNANGTTQYAIRAVVWDPNDGSGSLKAALYQGAATDLSTIAGYAPGAGSPFLQATATTAMRSGLVAGGVELAQLGYTSVGAGQTGASRHGSVTIKAG